MVMRKDIHGESQRSQVWKALRSFDDRGLDWPAFERQALALLQIPGASSAEDVLAYHQKKFRAADFGGEVPGSGGNPEHVDAILANRFNFYGEVHQLPSDFDWESNPGTHHWGHDLNRFSFVGDLTAAFLATRERRYAERAAALIVDWIAKADVCDAFIPKKSHYVWGCYLNIAIHLERWAHDLACLLREQPDIVSARNWLRILKSVHDQLCYLDIVIPETRNNWSTIGARGQLRTIAVFNELREARRLAKVAWERLEENVRSQLLPDGVHDELTQHYHLCVVDNIVNPMLMARSIPEPAPASLRQMLRDMLLYLRDTVTPEGKHLNFNDGDADCGPRVLNLLAHPLCRELLGAEADSELTSRYYPYAGVMILRQGSRRGKEELFLAFDGGPFGCGHQHEDKLSFWLSAYGRSLIVDPGRHLYDESEKSYRAYLLTSRAHSTIEIDGQGQNLTAFRTQREYCRAASPLPLVWTTGNGRITAGAAYDVGYGPDLIQVKHARRITFVPDPGYWIVEDEITGEGSHTIASRFQFAPGDLVVDGSRVHTTYPDANLLLITEDGGWDDLAVAKGQENPRLGWYSDGYNKIEPAPMLTLTARSRVLPFRSRIIFYPYRGTTVPDVPVSTLK